MASDHFNGVTRPFAGFLPESLTSDCGTGGVASILRISASIAGWSLGEGLDMALSPVPGWFILLSSDEAAQVRGTHGPMHALDPRRLDDGRFIVGENVLEQPAFAAHIPFLASLPLCRLLRDDETGAISVKPKSEKSGDISVIERAYEPRDKQNPLGDPPLPERGDWSEAKLYESVGRALTRWEAFETEFANLFTSLLGPSLDTTPAHRAYGSVISFRARLDMVNAAAEAFFMYFPKADVAQLPDLKKSYKFVADRADRLSGYRNKIAHGMVGEYTSPKGHVRGVAVMPAHYTLRQRKLAAVPRGSTVPQYAYTSGIVSFFGNQFWELRIPTADLWTKLARYIEILDDEDRH